MVNYSNKISVRNAFVSPSNKLNLLRGHAVECKDVLTLTKLKTASSVILDTFMMSAYVQAIPVSPKLGLQIALEKVSIFKVAITGTRLWL